MRFFRNYVLKQSPMKKTDELIGQHGIKFDNMVSVNKVYVTCIRIIYLPSGTQGVVAQSPEPEGHDKSD